MEQTHQESPDRNRPAVGLYISVLYTVYGSFMYPRLDAQTVAPDFIVLQHRLFTIKLL